jgi:hypothetical protein
MPTSNRHWASSIEAGAVDWASQGVPQAHRVCLQSGHFVGRVARQPDRQFGLAVAYTLHAPACGALRAMNVRVRTDATPALCNY